MDSMEIGIREPRRPRTGMVRMDALAYGPGRSKRPLDLGATAALVIGALLVLWSSYIHFHLWDETGGYRHIPTIGPLFLLQSIGGLLLGLLILAVRRLWAAVLGLGFALSTMVGFLISVEWGLFGFNESWAAPYAHQAFYIEVAAIVAFGVAGALCLVGAVAVPAAAIPA
jgi:hypothetical protein